MMSRILILMLLATVNAQYDGGDYSYDYTEDDQAYEDEVYDEVEELPEFDAKSQEFSVEVGGKITFPCEVKKMGSNVLMFKHILPGGSDRMLFVGDISLKPAAKFTKEGYQFTLEEVQRRHAGKYTCRIETDPVTEITHTLVVKYPATVTRISPQLQTVGKGESVTLECEAEGNPPPAIHWNKREGQLPSGSQTEEGLSITLENVDRRVEGTYVCTASNGIGQPASTEMSIEVEYPPEIISEQTIVHTGEGDEAKLLCIVHGRPAPKVVWMKDGEPINHNRHIQEFDDHRKHSLTITQVMLEDFGDYTCVAENDRGTEEHTLRLTGIPQTPKMTSSPAGGEENAYTITWETESYTTIRQYRLKYRKMKANVTAQDPGSWDDRLYDPQATDDIVSGHIHHMTHAIVDLEPATDYEASVSVENKFGWSDPSEVFHFYTRKEKAVSHTLNGAGYVTLSTTLLMFAIIQRFVA